MNQLLNYFLISFRQSLPIVGFIIILSFQTGCVGKMGDKSTNKEIIEEFNIIPLEGELILRGEEDLTTGINLFITDSLYTIISMTEDENIFWSYDLQTSDLVHAFGVRGNGPNEFLMPIPFNSLNDKKNFVSLFDINLRRFSDIYIDKDSLSISQKAYPRILDHSLEIGKVNGLYYGARSGSFSEGLFYIYDEELDSIRWIEYSSPIDSEVSPRKKYNMYYGRLCVSERGVVKSLDFFNKILFYDFVGNFIKEVQLGKEELTPNWNYLVDNVDYSSPSYLVDMCISEKYIYCCHIHVYYDKNGEEVGREFSKIHVFNWDFNYVSTFQLDTYAYSVDVDESDTFLLTMVSDGTGLVNVIRYEIPKLH